MQPRGVWGILCLLALFLPGGCRQSARASETDRIPVVRVRLLASQEKVSLAASHPPAFQVAGQSKRLQLPAGDVPLVLAPHGWVIGNFALGSGGVLIVEPEVAGSVRVNGSFREIRKAINYDPFCRLPCSPINNSRFVD